MKKNETIVSIKRTLEYIGGKWKLLIILSLLEGTKRNKQLIDDLDGITARQLSKELVELQRDNIVEKIVYNDTPVVIEYKITKQGKTLEGIINSLSDWGSKLK